MKKILLVLLIVFGYRFTNGQCSMKLISLNDRASQSNLIVEGKVVEKNSFWNAAHNMIYTSNVIEVYKIFKGDVTTSSVVVLTKGGTVGLSRITAHPSLDLNVGEIGVFTCEQVKRFDLSSADRFAFPVYEVYASEQGFIKYDLANQVAADPFARYTDIEKEVYNKVLSSSLRTWKTVKAFDFYAEAAASQRVSNPNQVQAVSISGFTPSTITAGTGSTITITGSGFGSTQGSGTVGFKNADDGGATYINPLATQIVSWSNTQIVVEVPSGAGTGTIQVTQGTTTTSSATLTVSYAHLNVEFDPGSGTEAYETDHVNDNGSGGYTWQMNPGFASNAAASAAFLRAFDNWRCNTGIKWTIGSNTSINDAVSDGTNVICFDNTSPLSAGVLGVCYSYWSGCASGPTIIWYVNELDIIFDDGDNITPLTWEYGPSTPSSSEYDFESVTVHELGHGHQLGHVINPGAIMHYALANGTFDRTPSTNDLNGANYVQAKSEVANICGPGAMTHYSCGTPPVADFSGTPTAICAGNSVSFTDQSTNTPTSWSWTFTGGTPSSSTSQNPTVTYSTPGTYAVSLTATNASGSDTKTTTAYITVNAMPSASISSQTNVSCNGGSDGAATVSVSSGTPAYSYLWSSGATTATASSLSAGTYTCTITDSKGCLTTKTATITAPSALSATPSHTNVSCNGLTDGTASVTVSGGTPAYAYNWSPSGGSAASASNLAAGTYTVTVVDSKGCTTMQAITITAPTALVVSGGNASAICAGSSASLAATSTGGTGSVSFNWMPGNLSGANQSVSPTTTTTYTVTGTDANGCTNTATRMVTVNTAPTLTVSATPSTITSGSSSTLTASGATSYSWMPGSMSGASVSVSPTTTTTYTVTGTGSNSCTNTATVNVTVSGSSGSSVPSTKVRTADCGITLSSMSQLIACNAVTGATDYEWQWVSGQTTLTRLRGSNNTNFNPTWVTGIQSYVTYDVSVRAKVGGNWGTFGTVCQITTMSGGVAGTQVRTADCGTTLAHINQIVYCDAVPSATNYEWEWTTGGVSKTFMRGSNQTSFNPTWITGMAHATTYDVRVRAYVGSNVGTYGSICQITTPVTGKMMNPGLAGDGTDINEVSVIAYPNPTNGKINIDASEKITGIELYSLSGELIMKDGTAVELDLKDLESGAYILTVRTETSVKHIRVLKQ